VALEISTIAAKQVTSMETCVEHALASTGLVRLSISMSMEIPYKLMQL
jgi:hypothetical protein